MDKFVPSIKEKYRERRINREKQWPPCMSNKLVNLELVEEEVNSTEGYCLGGKQDYVNVKRKPLRYGDLFGESHSIKKILVEGDAGIGKTTFSIAVSEDWANEKLFQQFELLLLLPLRHKKVAKASSLPELLKMLHSSQTLCDAVADHLEETEGSNVLIIADGWDEISESQQSEGSFLYELLFEDFLPFASVIVTSRPSASARFHTLSCIDQFVELVGFDKENITSYIRSEFANDGQKSVRLREQLERNTLVESLCTIPLNCAIICHLWRTLEEDLPSTMTELYTKIICNVVLRNIQKNGYRQVLNLHDFDALPEELKQAWNLMCRFAFQAIERDQVTFMQEELVEFFPESIDFEKILCFGLLQSSRSILEDGCGVSFHFLHLTIQEYLAALYLVGQLPDNEDEIVTDQPIVQRKLINKGRFDVVWRFFFGIFFNIAKRRDSRVITPYIVYTDSELVRCHCAYEAKNEDIDAHVVHSLKTTTPSGKISLHGSSAPDTDAVIHVLNKIHDCSGMYIYLEDCSIRGDQLVRLTNPLSNKHGKLKVTALSLAGNKLANESIFCLFLRASDAFQSLQYLNLRDNNIGADRNISFLPKKPSFTNIVWLNLSDNPLGVSGVQMLQEAVRCGSFTNLSSLEMRNCLTDNVDTNASLLQPLFEALISASSPLQELDLSQNNVGAPGASVLAKFLSKHDELKPEQHNWLSTLELKESHLDDKSLCTFVATLECPHTFSTLCLVDNDIHSAGIQCLADAVCSGKIVIKGFFSQLLLQDIRMGTDGAAAIGRMLKHGCQVHELNLSRCQLTRVESYTTFPRQNVRPNVSTANLGLDFCQGPQNDTIRNLYLDENDFSEARIHILVGFIFLCPCLRRLSTKNCEITSSELAQLLDKLCQLKASLPGNAICSRLVSWNLYGNKIGNDGIVALIRHQQASLFPLMSGAKKGTAYAECGFVLGENPVSNEMITVLNEELFKQERVS